MTATILVDGITNTIKLDNGNVEIVANLRIRLLAGNNTLKFGEVTDSRTTFQIYNTDKSGSVKFFAVGGTGNDSQVSLRLM